MWVRFELDGTTGFGKLSNGEITVHSGDMFASPQPTGDTVPLSDVTLLTPCTPGKMICLWNNFHQLAAKLEMPEPPEPLFFLKASSSFTPHGATVKRPASYDGPVVFEGELGIVIGATCKDISPDEAADVIFGYTCVNDITAAKIITRDATFAQWARAKSYDGFGVFGPGIATGIDPAKSSVVTILNGDERQNYPLSDMIFPPAELVSRLSHDMTLNPGDLIACGTSIGVGSMKLPENSVEITIDGIATLVCRFVN